MWRWILGLFLIAHGLIHAAVWLAPTTSGDNGAPFDPKHSWVMSGWLGGDLTRTVSMLMATVAMLGFVAGGFGLLTHQTWWRPLVIVAAVISLMLIGFYFNPWLSAGLGLEVAILIALLWANWPSPELVGM